MGDIIAQNTLKTWTLAGDQYGTPQFKVTHAANGAIFVSLGDTERYLLEDEARRLAVVLLRVADEIGEQIEAQREEEVSFESRVKRVVHAMQSENTKK